jgi:hypothetical protein
MMIGVGSNKVVAQNPSEPAKSILEDAYIHHAAQLIEAQMDWGRIDNWSDFEFERLSDVMHDSTGRRVDRDKLKLIITKKKFDSSLSTSYDVLAQFLHYSDWNNFKAIVFLKEH